MRGPGEPWVNDPLLVGPKVHGGPFALQLWRREGGSFTRAFAGQGPALFEAIGAWLHPRVSRIPSEARLCISDGRAGEPSWPTLIEQERRAAERRAVAAERELAELRAKLPR